MNTYFKNVQTLDELRKQYIPSAIHLLQNHTSCCHMNYYMLNDCRLYSTMIDKYTDLQRIKKANGDHENSELDYQLKVIKNKFIAVDYSRIEGISLSNNRFIILFTVSFLDSAYFCIISLFPFLILYIFILGTVLHF